MGTQRRTAGGISRHLIEAQKALLRAARGWSGCLMIVVPPDGQPTVRVDKQCFSLVGTEVEDLVARRLVKPTLAWVFCRVAAENERNQATKPARSAGRACR